LAPTAGAPSTKGQKARPPCYGTCEACGVAVLHSQTPTGTRVIVEVQARTTYVILWETGAALPTAHESRGYVTHHCGMIH